ncbi:MAG: hypothetical protein GF355_17300, partial [Candidatus Eisenbacteria bacterium]|nr:hypothetical protein [Candidatus Eisenbacteria bacterium]
GDPDSTTINCAYAGRGFIFSSGEDSTAVVAGVTITNGYLIYEGNGAGIYCYQSSPQVHSCIVRGNVAAGVGGGVYLQESSSWITECTVRENVSGGAAGGVYLRDWSGRIETCNISHNSATDDGGGVYVSSSSPTFYSTVVDSNSSGDNGGGVYIISSIGALEDCTLLGNTTTYSGGGLYCNGSSLEMVNCDIAQNSGNINGGGVLITGSEMISMTHCRLGGNSANAGYGGGVYVFGGELEIVSCGFFGNSAADGADLYSEGDPLLVAQSTLYGGTSTNGGSISLYNSNPTIHNTIIAFATQGRGLNCGSSSTPTLYCTDIYGNAGGDWDEPCIEFQAGYGGNISLDPLFCDAENGDFTLRSDSPCAPFSPPNEVCDLIGAWPVGCQPSTVDGAPESHGPHLLSGRPNPFLGSTKIRFDLPREGGSGTVRLEIFDSAGRLVRRLIDGQGSAGIRVVTWDGTNATGETVAAGTYFSRLKWHGGSETRPLILLR